MFKKHKPAHSTGSGIFQFIIGLIGFKRRMEKNIRHNSFKKVPAPVLKSIRKKQTVLTETYHGRTIWTLTPVNIQTDRIILFFHGGAYYANITKHHWRFIERLLISTNAGIIVPDYPLAPESTCSDVYRFLDGVYSKLISDHPEKQIVLMGDSAGGGLALGYAQKVRNDNIRQPDQIILISPWLDVSMTNPEIPGVEKSDKILSIAGLKIAGKKYAGNLKVTDYRVSPLYGEFSGLGKISVFIGTNELFIADARKLKKFMDERNIEFTYHEYPGMFHDWVIFPDLKETKDVIQKITLLLHSFRR